MEQELAKFLKDALSERGRIIPARVQAALALLERLRDFPTLSLTDHWKGGSSGVRSHETYGDRAHERLNLDVINRNHGRRSCNLTAWGQALLDIINSAGFLNASLERREDLLNQAQAVLGKGLKDILEQDPLEARCKGRSAESVIHDLLLQAEQKGKSGDVAQYLVGAKLVLRFGVEVPVQAANKSDRKTRSDPNAKRGDFEIADAVIEVAVGPPDPKHLEQIDEILESSDSEVWLLTRSDRVPAWLNELKSFESSNAKRVVVTAVETFVGQNISELASFSAKEKAVQLEQLFKIYNEQWVKAVGIPGIRIIVR